MISKILLFLILVQYYKNSLLLPVFEYGKNIPTEAKDITRIIVSGDLPGEILVSAISQFVEQSAVFLVDTSYLCDWRDLKRYINMKRSVTKTYYFQKIKNQLVGCSSEAYMYRAMRFIYAHKDQADFHKIIAKRNHLNGEHSPVFYVQYSF